MKSVLSRICARKNRVTINVQFDYKEKSDTLKSISRIWYRQLENKIFNGHILRNMVKYPIDRLRD